MPHQFALTIELLDDAVFSNSNATAGAHDTLDRIPGSALLGAAAARLYSTMRADEAFLAFHSGKLRFGDGWPLSPAGTVALPAPMCLHRAKEDDAWQGDDHRVVADHVRNLLRADGFAGNQQPKQLRDAYLTLAGRWVKPRTRHRLKTAIDPKVRRAKEGQLFGYSALDAGQRFVAEVHADADVPQSLLDAVRRSLTGRILVGRSRSAEYGAARIEVRDGPAFEPTVRPGEPASSRMTLWLLADLAPADEAGCLPGEVGAQSLGLPEGCRVDWSRSFARARRYSPWNAYRHGYDGERWVLEAGSVLSIVLPHESPTFSGRDALTRQIHEHGLGLFREAGLGRVWVDAPLLSADQPVFDAEPLPTVDQTVDSVRHGSGYAADLGNWLSSRGPQGEADDDRIEAFVRDYHKVLRRGRRAAGIPEHARDYYPSSSQWGSVYERLRRVDAGGVPGAETSSLDALFDATNGVIKASAKGWGLEVRQGVDRSLAGWLREQWRADWNDPVRLRRLVWHLKKRADPPGNDSEGRNHD